MPPKKKVTPPAPVSVPTPEPEEVVVVSEAKEKKPRAKRAPKTASEKQAVAVVSSAGIQGSLAAPDQPRKPLIVHLPIQSSSVQFYENAIRYDPAPPKDTEAFNPHETDPFIEEGEAFDNNDLVKQIVNSYSAPKEEKPKEEKAVAVIQPKKEPVATAVSATQEYGPTKLLIEYANTKSTHELPECTESACFWCCEQFTNRPCIIPISILEGIWQVYGNYCTPNCAMAALLAEPLDTHVRWERIALLHNLYSESYKGGRIYPAPDRTVLQRFGGPVSATDFRAICERGRLRIDIHMPPLVSILASMDTKPIDFYESTLLHNTSVQNMPSNQAADGGLKLKRSKPLKEKEHTLDNILGFRVGSKAH
jgi:hypothetical protein